MTPNTPTWGQVLKIKHWHACDLDTHTLAECRADTHHTHAIIWGADVLSFSAVIAVLFVVARPIGRMLDRRKASGRLSARASRPASTTSLTHSRAGASDPVRRNA